MDRPGSAEIRVAGSTPSAAHAARVTPRPLGLGRGRLAVDIGDAESAADHELGEIERGEEAAQYLGRLLERRGFEDLAADVRMDADEFSPRQQLECADRLGRRAGRHREPEFGVLLSGPHEFMSVRLDSRGYPDQDPGPLGACRWAIEQSTQSGDLVKGVDHDAAHPAGQGVGQLLF